MAKPSENYLIKLIKALPIKGFIEFNFGKDPDVIEHEIIHPDLLDYHTGLRLLYIQKSLGGSAETVKKLNLPSISMGEPIYYKYCYEYMVKFKTNKKSKENIVSHEEIIKPVDNHELFATLLM